MVDAAFMRKTLSGTNFEMTYGGALSFMRRNFSKDLTGVDVAISGIPFDLAVTYRSGARLGPRAIRAASVQLAELLPYPYGKDIFKRINVIDYGDCFLDVHNPLTIHQTIIDHINTIINSNVIPLTFGGDHYITYPILCAMAQKYKKPISLIHFDAHCDTWTDDEEHSLNHGTMFYKAIKNKIISPEHSVQIGIRTWNNNYHGMNVIDSQWVHDNGWKKTVDAIKEFIPPDNLVYITCDIDALDPAFAPGTGTPVAGGLSSAQLLSIIRNLPLFKFIGADVVEVSPSYDHAEITALAAAHIACDLLTMLAKAHEYYV